MYVAVKGGEKAIANAHASGLTVIGWTFRKENAFLPL